MDVVSGTANSDIATVYIGKFGEGRFVEFVESVQPPLSVEKKWVLILSTMFGCPVGCKMCDAGSFYSGKLSAQQMFDQIDFLVLRKFGSRNIPVEKFKIQFARMGEPALNQSVLDVIEKFPNIYNAPGFVPSISTIAPNGTDKFFKRLTNIKKDLYGDGKFQMQFSIHSTSEQERDKLIPVKKWRLQDISGFGEDFYSEGDKKITLNFVFSGELELDSKVLGNNFDKEKFIIKITPVNPTVNAINNGINTEFESVKNKLKKTVSKLKEEGFDVIVSVGELEENKIGSNCGQYIGTYLKSASIGKTEDMYSYKLGKVY